MPDGGIDVVALPERHDVGSREPCKRQSDRDLSRRSEWKYDDGSDESRKAGWHHCRADADVDARQRWAWLSGDMEVYRGQGRSDQHRNFDDRFERNHLTLPEFQMSCKAAFDGKDYAVVGGGANLKQAFAFERLGPNSFRMTTKLNGKPFYVDVMTLSADGRTLTDEGNAISVNEPVKAVYDRQ